MCREVTKQLWCKLSPFTLLLSAFVWVLGLKSGEHTLAAFYVYQVLSSSRLTSYEYSCHLAVVLLWVYFWAASVESNTVLAVSIVFRTEVSSKAVQWNWARECKVINMHRAQGSSWHIQSSQAKICSGMPSWMRVKSKRCSCPHRRPFQKNSQDSAWDCQRVSTLSACRELWATSRPCIGGCGIWRGGQWWQVLAHQKLVE